MPAEAKAAFDGVISRIDQIAFRCDLAGKGEAASKQKGAANEDIAISLFHHIFPGSDHHALDDAGAVGFGKSRTRTRRQRRDFNLLSRFLGKIPDWVVRYLPLVIIVFRYCFSRSKLLWGKFLRWVEVKVRNLSASFDRESGAECVQKVRDARQSGKDAGSLRGPTGIERLFVPQLASNKNVLVAHSRGCVPTTSTSTRRFFARPSRVVLLATGWLSPLPSM